eukprot:1137886-Pelagomonas_calceolata.AAC.1
MHALRIGSQEVTSEKLTDAMRSRANLLPVAVGRGLWNDWLPPIGHWNFRKIPSLRVWCSKLRWLTAGGEG